MIAVLIAPGTEMIRSNGGCYTHGDAPLEGDCIKIGWSPMTGKCRIGYDI